MSSVQYSGSSMQLSSVAVPPVAQQFSDTQVVREAISSVVGHYGPSAVCLVLEGEQGLHIKAACGMSTGKLPFSSITRHVTGRPLPIIIYDAKSDERFEGDSLVTGPLATRFFVSAPVIVQGTCVGSLCLLDKKPRSEFTLDECSVIQDAAETIGQHLESWNMAALCAMTMITLESLPLLEEYQGSDVSEESGSDEEDEEQHQRHCSNGGGADYPRSVSPQQAFGGVAVVAAA